MKPDHVERIWMLIIGILAGIISTVLAQMLIAKYVSPNKHNTQIELASNDPRKELANIGVLWSDENFLEAISRGDARAVKLFLDGGFDPYIIVGGVQSLPIKLTINRTNPREVVKLLVERKGGFDLNHIYHIQMGYDKWNATILEWSIMQNNMELLQALYENGVDLNKKIDIYSGRSYSILPRDWSRERAKQDKSYEPIFKFIEKNTLPTQAEVSPPAPPKPAHPTQQEMIEKWQGDEYERYNRSIRDGTYNKWKNEGKNH